MTLQRKKHAQEESSRVGSHTAPFCLLSFSSLLLPKSMQRGNIKQLSSVRQSCAVVPNLPPHPPLGVVVGSARPSANAPRGHVIDRVLPCSGNHETCSNARIHTSVEASSSLLSSPSSSASLPSGPSNTEHVRCSSTAIAACCSRSDCAITNCCTCFNASVDPRVGLNVNNGELAEPGDPQEVGVDASLISCKI